MQNLKFLTCVHGSKVPFLELNSPTARDAEGNMIYCRKGQSLGLYKGVELKG